MQRPGFGGPYLDRDALTPIPPDYNGYSPSSNYVHTPAADEGFPDDLDNDPYGSNTFVPPPDVFLENSQRPTSDSNASNEQNSRSSQQLDLNDPVTVHLLVETARADSQEYQALPFEEVEILKREQQSLRPKIDATQKKLAQETKIRDAAQSITRLYSGKGEERRRTSSSRHSRNDSLSKSEAELATANKKVEDITRELWQLETRSQKLEVQLLRHTAGILQLTHQGPVKQDDMRSMLPDGMARSGRPDSPESMDNYNLGKRKNNQLPSDGFDERSLYRAPDNIDSLMEALKTGKGMELGASATTQEDPEVLIAVQTRLEELNLRLRELIVGVNPDQNQDYSQAPNAMNSKAGDIVGQQLNYLDQGLRDLGGEQEHLVRAQSETQKLSMEYRLEELNNKLRDVLVKADRERNGDYAPAPNALNAKWKDVIEEQLRYLDQAIADVDAEQAAMISGSGDAANQSRQMEEKLESMNTQLFNIIQACPSQGELFPPPPQVSGQGAQGQLTYLDEALYTVNERNQFLMQSLDEAKSQSAQGAQGSPEIESTLQTLWADIIDEENRARQRKRQMREMIREDPNSLDQEEDLSPDEEGSADEPFSMPSFSSRVRFFMRRVTGLKEQRLILRRQIRQQRELGAKSDTEAQEQNTQLNEKLQQTQAQLMSSDNELNKMMEEIGRLKMLDQQRETQGNSASNEKIAALEAERAEFEAGIGELQKRLELAGSERQQFEAEAKQASDTLKAKEEEYTELEIRVANLQTEVTIAQAELDGAYGSKADRAKAAASSPEIRKEVEALTVAKEAAERNERQAMDREKQLKDELAGMANDYESLTKDGIQMEKEREQHEGMIDALRDEKEKLEVALSDAKAKQVGLTSPGGGPEMTSVKMMREDFRRMMRERTADGLKALRSEQEERRKLEALIRQLRKEGRPAPSSLRV